MRSTTIPYLADALPFCGQENGELSGILHTVTDTLEREYGITVETKAYTGLSEMKQAMREHEVDLMGGTISVESIKGKGTTVIVKLPLELSAPIEKKAESENTDPDKLKNVQILMAEDNELNAESATILLEDRGTTVTRAVDGRQVVEMFKSHPAGTYNAILMDIMMPEMNGYEATKAIREIEDRPDGKTIPIIAMTANAFVEDVQVAIEAGMNAHLAKPIVIDTVTKVIAENLSLDQN